MGLGGNSDIQPTVVNQQLLRTGVDYTRKIRGVGNTYNTTSNINGKYTKYITYIIVINFWVYLDEIEIIIITPTKILTSYRHLTLSL